MQNGCYVTERDPNGAGRSRRRAGFTDDQTTEDAVFSDLNNNIWKLILFYLLPHTLQGELLTLRYSQCFWFCAILPFANMKQS